ncbi:MAG: hypothetical protein ACPKPY_08675 [Nitrososphaeraceae archaeon]
MYPYNLKQNPFPSGPTPDIDDAKILGGRRHIGAKNAIFSCINDVFDSSYSNINNHDNFISYSNSKFKVITVVQDVGSGKTHLSLHTRFSEINEKAIFSYIDLSRVYPKTIPSIYQSMIQNFPGNYLSILRRELLFYIRDKYDSNHKYVKKIFKSSFFDSFSGKGIETRINEFLDDKLDIESRFIYNVLENEFSKNDINLIIQIIENKFQDNTNLTLLDMIDRLSLLSRLNLRLLDQISVFQFDEFDNNPDVLSFVKALINAHVPSTILMLILTPHSYNGISLVDPSIFDRLEKANYKIDLAGSNSFEEISDIVLEYIHFYRNKSDYSNASISNPETIRLISKLKVLYDEFKDFRNIRSFLNIMYNSFENAKKRNIPELDEKSLDETIKILYPGLKIKGSMMNLSISEYIKIKNLLDDPKKFNEYVTKSIKLFIEKIIILDESYKNSYLMNVMCTNIQNNSQHTTVMIQSNNSENTIQPPNNVSSSMTKTNNSAIATLNNYANNVQGSNLSKSSLAFDKIKLMDLIYYTNKLESKMNTEKDDQCALLLAKSLNL